MDVNPFINLEFEQTVQKRGLRTRKLTGETGVRCNQVSRYQNIAGVVGGVTVGGVVVIQKFTDAFAKGQWPELGIQSPELSIMVVLFFVLCGLLYQWYDSSNSELQNIFDWLSIDHTVHRASVFEALMAAAVVLSFAGLLITLESSRRFPILYAVFLLMDILVQIHVKKNVFSSLDKSRELLKESMRQATLEGNQLLYIKLKLHGRVINALSEYYRSPKQFQRQYIMLFATLLLVAWRVSVWELESTFINVSVFLGCIIIIVSGEVSIHTLRKPMIECVQDANDQYNYLVNP